MPEKPPLVLYHARCNDGLAAAWVARQRFPDAELVPVQYGEKPPDVFDRDLYILDLSYKLPVMSSLYTSCRTMMVLDHHESAEKELKDFRGPKATVVFDMTKSGGRLTWENFYRGMQPPWIVTYTEDRDLWRWKLPDSLAINAALASYPQTLESWDTLNPLLDTPPSHLVGEGQAILRYQQGIINGLVAVAQEVEWAGHKVRIVNATCLISEVAGKLAEGRAFGCCWFHEQGGKFVYSLRSSANGINVSELASKYGGGGHARASGFTAPSILTFPLDMP